MTEHPKKLIEVALPLEDINAASAREKSIRHGHPSTLHLWWARRPLAAARAVLFAQLVDDPSGYVDELWEDSDLLKKLGKKVGRPVAPHEQDENFDDILINLERERLFDLIRQLVLWENTNNESVLEPAREEILVSWRRTCRREGKPEDTPMPPFLDPFAGGGAIPLEAQRLGLEAHASDLNPVAVLINKAMIEIPPKFANLPPVHPEARKEMGTTGWKGAAGLAEDVRRYGQWMRDEAEKRIGHLYPPYELTQELIDSRPDLQKAGYKAGDKLTVIAWLWARTVPSPNPALSGKQVPLISSFWLSKKKGKEVWVKPEVSGAEYKFKICTGTADEKEDIARGTKSEGRGANFTCLISGVPIDAKYIRQQGKEGQLASEMFAVVCEGNRGRVYLEPNEEHLRCSTVRQPEDLPKQTLPSKALGFRIQAYGMKRWTDLFTSRQLVNLSTFCDIIRGLEDKIGEDLVENANYPEYHKAVSLYLSFAIDKMADLGNSLVRWEPNAQCPRQLFGRQAIPMVWDYAEANPFSSSSGCWETFIRGSLGGFEKIASLATPKFLGKTHQADAGSVNLGQPVVISSDPPYYDNIAYADLSDFFYIWLRKSLGGIYRMETKTMHTPKDEELVACPFRRGNEAESYFLSGMGKAIQHLGMCSRAYFV